MWFRLELGSDGEILSCTEVESARRNNAHVCYIEAEDKSRAVVAAQRWAEMRRKNTARITERRLEQRAMGECQYGRCPYAPESGKLYCPAHLADMRERVEKYTAGVRIRPVRTDAEKYEHRREIDRPLARKLRILEDVLAAYRHQPSFEVWLTTRIREIRCQLNAASDSKKRVA